MAFLTPNRPSRVAAFYLAQFSPCGNDLSAAYPKLARRLSEKDGSVWTAFSASWQAE
jgi:hypothetical protein